MDVLARLALAQAARLARRGDYRPAEALLGEAVVASGGARADVLDLKARIRAQQGRWAEAEALWREALALDPESPDIQAALELLARPSRGRGHLAGLAARSLAGVAVLILVWAVVAQRREIRRLATAPTVAPPAALVAAADTPIAVPRVEAALLDSLEAVLTHFPGVEVLRHERELEVRFLEGLFTEGLALRPGASDLVARLAEILETMGDRVGVRVVGHTDSLPLRASATYSSNRTLGFARAARIADILLSTGAVVAQQTSVQSAADASPPHAGDTPEGARRNRTVTLHLAPAA